MAIQRIVIFVAAMAVVATATSKTLASYTSNDDYAVCAVDGETRRAACFGTLGAARVPPPTQRIESLTVGRTHACAIDSSHGGVCWGPAEDERQGSLKVPSGSQYAQVLACNSWTCSIDEDGATKCWGAQGPWLDVPSGRYRSLACGDTFVCGLLFNGSVSCWGDDTHGIKSGIPANSVKFGTVAAGPTHACGTTMADKFIVCWGDASYEKCDAPSGIAVTAISCAETYCCASDVDGMPVCWGSEIPEGLPKHKARSVSSPYTISKASSMVVGPEWACAVSDSGERACVGNYRFILPRTIHTNPCLYGECANGDNCLDSCICPTGYTAADDNTFCECNETAGTCLTCAYPEILGHFGECTLCGNSQLETSEVCDPSVTNDPHCSGWNCTCNAPYVKNALYANCSLCGNGQLDGSEQCDLGTNCQVNCSCPASSSKWVKKNNGCSYCGNGVIDSGEDCDGGLNCDPDTCLCPSSSEADASSMGCLYKCALLSAVQCNSGSYDCRMCGSSCLPGRNSSCCNLASDGSTCSSYSGCQWCGYELSPLAPCNETCPSVSSGCDLAQNRFQCSSSVDASGDQCVMCGLNGCMSPSDCTPSVAAISASVETPCEAGWTDIVVKAYTTNPVQFDVATWYLRKSEISSNYLLPAKYGRSAPIVTQSASIAVGSQYLVTFTVAANQTEVGDEWRLKLLAFDTVAQVYTNVITVDANSTVCAPTCQQRAKYAQCIANNCSWCSSKSGCRDNSSACPAINFCPASPQTFTHSWAAKYSESGANCSVENMKSTSYSFAWLYSIPADVTTGTAVRLSSVCLAISVLSDTPLISSTLIPFKLKVYNISEDSVGYVVREIDFDLAFDSPGDYGVSKSFFMEDIRMTTEFYIGVEWINVCPPINLRIKPSARRAPTPIVEGTPTENGTSTWSGVTGVEVPKTFVSPCGNDKLDGNEECDGGIFCTDTCNCSDGWVSDNDTLLPGCKLDADPAFVCEYFELSGALDGTIIASATVSNLSQCQSLCCLTSGCLTYTFTESSSGSTCELHNTEGAQVSCSNGAECSSGIISQCPSVREEEVVAYAKDENPNQTFVEVVSSENDCARKCCAKDGCVAWTYFSSPNTRAGECQYVTSGGWLITNVEGAVSGFTSLPCSTSPQCDESNSHCQDCACTFGRQVQSDGSCTCKPVQSHSLVSPPYLKVALDGTNLQLSVYLPDTNPARTNARIEFNSYSLAFDDTEACLLDGYLTVPVSSLPGSADCSTSFVGSQFRLTCSVSVKYTETVTLAEKKRSDLQVERNITSTLKFYLGASTSFTVEATAFTLSSKTLWAVVSKSKILANSVGKLQTEIDLTTRSPVGTHIDSASVSFANHGAISNASIVSVSSEISKLQTWKLLLTLDTTKCTLDETDNTVMSFQIVYGSSRTSGSILIALGSTESLCSVTTGQVEKFTANSVVSGYSNFSVANAQYFIGTQVFVGIQLGLSFIEIGGNKITADVDNITISGNAVNATNNKLVLDKTLFGISTYSCPEDKNYSLCYTLTLLPGYFIESQQMTITSAITVTGVDLSKRNARVAYQQNALAKSTIFVQPRLSPKISAAANTQQQEVVIVYQTPVVAVAILVVIALFSGAGLAGLMFFLMQRRSSVSA